MPVKSNARVAGLSASTSALPNYNSTYGNGSNTIRRSNGKAGGGNRSGGLTCSRHANSGLVSGGSSVMSGVSHRLPVYDPALIRDVDRFKAREMEAARAVQEDLQRFVFNFDDEEESSRGFKGGSTTGSGGSAAGSATGS